MSETTGASEQAAAIRRGAGLFRLADRGLIEVGGEDRARWLGGMVSGDVESLSEGPETSGCYALLLTPQGRIVADLHVVLRPDAFWLELAAHACEDVAARLDRYVIADDVTLVQRGPETARLAVEGPKASEVVARACGSALPSLAPECATTARLGGVEVVAAAWGFTGEPALQLFAPAASAEAVEQALRDGAREAGVDLVAGEAETLELMRIEAGVPLLGPDLDETVLPPEARLDRAISTTKGCYTGQEVVARLRSRGKVAHLLVGLRLDGVADDLSDLSADGKRVGEITSRVSSSQGDIALGYVRRDWSEPGTQLSVGDGRATVSALPFGASGESGE